MVPPERSPETALACRVCGLIQRAPSVQGERRAACRRCRSLLADRQGRAGMFRGRTSTVAALSLSGLILYPFAISMPVMRVSELGHTTTATVWSGMVSLLAEGHVLVGGLVLLGSVVAPIGKLGAMLALCAGDLLVHRRHHAITYRVVEWLGRWGMLDVLLIAVLAAVVKLGDWVEVEPGPGVFAFAAVVALSILASAAFHPGVVWESAEPAERNT